jgi:methylglutaconyl-CoA hydratase
MNTAYRTLKAERRGAVLDLRLFRPQAKNAFNPELIGELRDAVRTAEADPDLRAVTLRGEGGTFCSGGDLNWMRDSLAYSREENLRDAGDLYALFAALDRCRLPVLGLVEGFALGGGIGLVSACDYVIARRDAVFSLSEVRVGLVPACIGPFVVSKIGMSHARALFLASERFGAERALRIGLIHEIAEDAAGLEMARSRVTEALLSASPRALAAAKEFLRALSEAVPGERGPLAARTLADIRVTPEAQEGVRAFLEKRSPAWRARGGEGTRPAEGERGGEGFGS